jgi:cobalt/nickel transport system ATP-binding protein
MSRSEPVIEVQDLTFAYPGQEPSLVDVSFAVPAEESVGLIGPNGAGKTSLFLCLCGVLTPRTGHIAVGGLDVRDPAQRRRLAERVGIVFQDSDDQLFCATVQDDVAFGPLNLGLPATEVRKRVAEALGKVGLQGYDERSPIQLSGGEKRRVALAGVLAMRPQVLLLDEPSLYLDARGKRALVSQLKELGGTRIIASHDLELILQTCERVLVLDGGRLVVDGSAHNLLSDSQLMEKHGLEVPFRLRG